ncbi:small acid-soluble spore protein alpha/beta type [Paenibacillus methanolicus]|uniref:Small acid-soluble spore protein alpha/beta type n=1 Tax=Paenibacillus methanolicus TaxID=582686 RepID=A0A5S5BLM6_9BACL|nr:small acid-soluble spore protein alpha/beta type [Paenibacillus methanolicus]
MSRRRKSTMSEQLKYELAKDLGFYETVQKEGWGGIRAKDAGNMVKRAIQLAEQAAAKQYEDARAAERADAVAQRYTQQQQRQTPSYATQPSQGMQRQEEPVYAATAIPAVGIGATSQTTAAHIPSGSTYGSGSAIGSYGQSIHPNPQQPQAFTQQSPYIARSQRSQAESAAAFIPFGAMPRQGAEQPSYRN